MVVSVTPTNYSRVFDSVLYFSVYIRIYKTVEKKNYYGTENLVFRFNNVYSLYLLCSAHIRVYRFSVLCS